MRLKPIITVCVVLFTITAGVATAATEYSETFEDGDANGWDNSPSVESAGYDGTYSIAPSDTTHTWTDGPSLSTSEGFYATGTLRGMTSGDSYAVKMRIVADNDNYIALIQNTDSGEFNANYRQGGSTQFAQIGSASSGTWYRFNISADSSNIKMKVWEAGNGEPDSWQATHSTSGGWSGAQIEVAGSDSNIDNVYVNNAGYATNPVSGTVTDSSGNPISGVNVSTGAGASTTTSSDGSWSLDLADGDYTITASKSGYKNQSQNVSVSGSAVTGVDFSMVDADQFEMQYGLDDRTNDTIFEDEDPRLIVERPDGSVTTTSFNHNQNAFVKLLDSRTYNLTVTSEYPAVWDFYGFIAVKAIDEGTLVMDSELWDETYSIGTTTEVTPGETPTLDDRLEVRFNELEGSLAGNGTAVTVRSPEPVEEVDYTIRDDNGTALYNGSREFEEPTQYWQGRLSDSVTNNASELDDPSVTYSGNFENGSTFNGTTDLSASLGTGGMFGGPTGTSSSGDGASTGGAVLLAGGAAVAAYRFRRPLINAASSAVGRVTG